MFVRYLYACQCSSNACWKEDGCRWVRLNGVWKRVPEKSWVEEKGSGVASYATPLRAFSSAGYVFSPFFPKHFVLFVWFYLEGLLLSQKTKHQQSLLFLYIYFLFSIFHSNRPKKRGKKAGCSKNPLFFCAKDLIHTVGNKWDHNKALLKIWRESDKRAIFFFQTKRT